MKKLMILFMMAFAVVTGINAQSIDSVRIQNVQVLGTNSARINFTYYGNEQSSLGRAYWGPTGFVNTFWSPSYTIPAGTDTMSVVIYSLSSNTNYDCKFFIFYTYTGDQAVSNIKSFTTSDCTLDPTVTSTVLSSCKELLTADTIGKWYRNGAFTGVTSQTDTVSLDGSYTILVTDANGCSGTSAPVTVDVDEVIVTTCSDKTTCAGISVILTASGATTYLWSDGATGSSHTVSPLTTTTFSVVGTSGGCNSASVSVKVTVNPLPTNVSIIALPNKICDDAVTPIVVETSPDGGNSTPSAYFSGNTFLHNVAGVGSHTVTYTFTDANGCTNTDDVTIEVLAPPSITGSSYENQILILTGTFPYPIELIFGEYIYTPVAQNSTEAIFMGIPSIEIGDLLLIQSIEGGCFAMATYLSVEELSFNGEKGKVDPRIFNLQGQEVKFPLGPGVYIRTGKDGKKQKFVVTDMLGQF